MKTTSATPNQSHWSVRALWIVAVMAVAQAIGINIWYWPGSMPDTDTSGVWIALAHDVAHGDLYRPLHSTLGTGGTRYMPLFFSLHGGLIRTGISPITSGMFLTLASAFIFVIALGCLLRRLELPSFIAWPTAVLMTGTVSFEMMTLTVRGDFLAAGFNLLGLTAALRYREKATPRRLLIAAVLFAAAFLTKLTSVFGLLAIVGWMLTQRETTKALRLFITSSWLMLVGVLSTLWVSEGRMLDSFLTVAHGGSDTAFALQGPRRFLIECLRDPLCCILLIPAVIIFPSAPRSIRGNFMRWLAGTTLMITIFIFGSPGTGANHLLDLQALCAAALALGLISGRPWRIMSGLAIIALGLGIGVTWLPHTPSIPAFFKQHQRPAISSVQAYTSLTGKSSQPILSENPLIPIIAGERPYVADMFNLSLMMRQDAGLLRNIEARLRRGEFGTVVISNWPDMIPHDFNASNDPLSPDSWSVMEKHSPLVMHFQETLQRHYRIVLVRRPYIYLLRNDIPFPVSP